MSSQALKSRRRGPRPAKLIVRFDQQQRQLLEQLRSEGTFGREDGEIIRNVVLDYIKQNGRQGIP